MGADWAHHIVLLPFLLLSLYVAFGRYLHRAMKLSQTYYGLTDKRVIFVQDGRRTTTSSVSLADLDDIDVEEYRNGNGSIRLGNVKGTVYEDWGEQMGRTILPWMDAVMPPKFENIANVQEVADALRNAQQAATEKLER